jgi:hypothetical protein
VRPRPFFERSNEGGQGRHRLLLVSYHFPPDATIGSRRWERLAHFVAERGWGLDVITRSPVGDAGRERLEALPAGVRVFGVPAATHPVERLEYLAWRLYRLLRDAGRRRGAEPAASAAVPGGAGPPARPGWLDRSDIRWRLYTPRGLFRTYSAWLEYVKYRRWARLVAALARTIVEPGVHRAIVASGPPHMTSEAARTVSRWTGLPFVMDMRDPWSLSERVPEGVASPLWFRLAQRYEAEVVGQAALIVANTETAREALAVAYPEARHRLITAMNGSDDDPIPSSRFGHRFTIAYAGTIYLERHPRSLFQAAAAVVGELGLTPADFGIDFIGADGPGYLLEMARQEGVAAFVSSGPARSHGQALEFLASAPMLVAFPGWDRLAVPAKIFECVRFDAWLLALTEPGTAMDRLVRGIGADVVRPNDTAAIAAVIRRRYEEYRRGGRPVRAVPDDRFSRRVQAGILLDAVAELTSTKGRTGGRR